MDALYIWFDEYWFSWLYSLSQCFEEAGFRSNFTCLDASNHECMITDCYDKNDFQTWIDILHNINSKIPTDGELTDVEIIQSINSEKESIGAVLNAIQIVRQYLGEDDTFNIGRLTFWDSGINDPEKFSFVEMPLTISEYFLSDKTVNRYISLLIRCIWILLCLLLFRIYLYFNWGHIYMLIAQ